MISEIDIRDWGQNPTKPIESVEQYKHFLGRHDWTYAFSDDHSVWASGRRARAYLLEARALFDPEGSLWKFYEAGL